MDELISQIEDYRGNCERCGEEINEPFLLVSDTLAIDQHGNRIFLLIGIVDGEDARFGHRLYCPKCGYKPLVLCLYESTDVTELVTKDETRHAL